MAKNDFEHPQEARKAQDVDVPGMTLPEGSHHTGRGISSTFFKICRSKATNISTGGAANKYTPTENEQREARENNEKVRSESFRRSGSTERNSIRALADKAKDAVTGKK